MPGESLTFSFEAKVAGAFLYHCGTAPALLHIGAGMYGAIIVDPATPLPPVDKAYVLVQGEWYTQQVAENLMTNSYEKMLRVTPDEVVFNGIAFQYRDHPLEAKTDEKVRLYVVNAGPSLWSAFHIIGGIFDKVYLDGDQRHALSGISTQSVAPGAGVVLDITFPTAGEYVFVDHSMASAVRGAVGVINVRSADGSPAPQPKMLKAKPIESAATPAPTVGPYRYDPERGALLYTTKCASCHQIDGTGMAGVFPAIKGNTAVLNTDATKHIQVVLNGSQGGVIDGVSYLTSMPPFRAQLSDPDIADIINYERNSWENKSKKITADHVNVVRTTTK